MKATHQTVFIRVLAGHLAGAATAEPRLFDASRAGQLVGPHAEDIVPDDPGMRPLLAERTAFSEALPKLSQIPRFEPERRW